ncbi:hypothetical protein GSI_14679 [Ganoderma sinense ZZ0214-1]|uniref:Uncharacterized protein n=1 Tax=Ganoderma sinense ZZ0214-1 TaxID=1077348 RepID=A0A2G8RPV1_9APHY|nr:hypothetical protein GSI_14679 [Ganoderma sinense ZZ0214-1]
MSVSGVKPLRSPAPQLEGRPSYERDFGIGTHEVYADPVVVQREFQRVHDRVDDVKQDLKATRDALDEKISGLETRLTAKIDAQKVYMDDKFEQQEEKFQRRMSQLATNLDTALDVHSEKVAARFEEMDKKIDDLKQMIQQLLAQGGAPPTPLPSASSQVPLPANPPDVVVHAAPAPVAGPSNPPRHHSPSLSSLGTELNGSHHSNRGQLRGLLYSIKRKVSKGLGILSKDDDLDQ